MTSAPSQSRLFADRSEVNPALPRPSRIGQTAVFYKPARGILTRATGFMNAYDFALNSYSGCSFGCTYCYAAFFSRNTQRRDS